MKVLNLQCAHGHGFEGWFDSEEAFQEQLARGLLECPMCGEQTVLKLPSAPHLNLGEAGHPGASAESGRQNLLATTPDAALQAGWLRMARHVLAHTEDVGERFAEEARRMHYGESEERGIRGQATREEARALLEEGIGVLPLPLPKGLKEPLQ